ncbi:MAG TPA: methylmalonyl-CoA mutase, partial [Archaeoglobus veneficus]|nr:methylmalonyl-CoA mutase [Archaeoglobus veneficus]
MNKKEWEEKYVEPLLKKAPERKKEFKTYSGIVVDRVYTPEDVEIDYETKLSYPGVYPFTRGVYPTMYRGRVWT